MRSRRRSTGERSQAEAAIDDGGQPGGIAMTFDRFEGGHGCVVGAAWQLPEARDCRQIEGGIEANRVGKEIAGAVVIAVAGTEETLDRGDTGAFFVRGERRRFRQRAEPHRKRYPRVRSRRPAARFDSWTGLSCRPTHRTAIWFRLEISGRAVRRAYEQWRNRSRRVQSRRSGCRLRRSSSRSPNAVCGRSNAARRGDR